jgi:hypothetical protein
MRVIVRPKNAFSTLRRDNRSDRRECLAVISDAQSVNLHVGTELEGAAFAVYLRKIVVQHGRNVSICGHCDFIEADGNVLFGFMGEGNGCDSGRER